MKENISNIFLDKNWCSEHEPELDIDIPRMSKIFDSISRSEQFYSEIRENYGNLKLAFQNFSQRLHNSEISNELDILRECIQISENLLKNLEQIKEFSIEEIPWKEISEQSEELIKSFSEWLGGLGFSEDERNDYLIRSIEEARKALWSLRNDIRTKKYRLSNNPFLFLLGEAGIGKTHLLCKIISNRLDRRLPSVLVFGKKLKEKLDTESAVVPQVIEHLNLGTENFRNEFLEQLNEAGEKAKCRALFILDAANEMFDLENSRYLVQQLYQAVRQYPYIALIISVRNGYQDLFISKGQKNFEVVSHLGFEDQEREAVEIFFKEYQVPSPQIPLLTPEFSNPQFLRVFCRAYKSSKVKKLKDVFRWHEGANHVFEQFIKELSPKIISDYNLDGNNTLIWNEVIQPMAEYMAKKNIDKLSEDETRGIIERAPNIKDIEVTEFLEDLRLNMLLDKIPNYDNNSRKWEGFSYCFLFPKFSEHLRARYILKNYRKQRKTHEKSPEDFFKKNTDLGQLLLNPNNKELVEALMIQYPQHFRGEEFIEVAPYLKDKYLNIFIDSLIRREPTAFRSDTKKSLAVQLNKFQDRNYSYPLLNALITVAGCPDHPLNIDFLHEEWLSKLSMPKRDSQWSVFLHDQFGDSQWPIFLHRQVDEYGAVVRLLEWVWSEDNKPYICAEIRRLLSKTLAWFLTTPNRIIRDKATKGLVCILTNRLDICCELLEIFDDVDDVYILERLYAVAYGCALRSYEDTSGIKKIALWIYDKQFSTSQPTPHLLLRDYARGVIEVALDREIPLDINEGKIRPPYKSEWIPIAHTKEELKEEYYPEEKYYLEEESDESKGKRFIWLSVFGGDFDRYVISYNVKRWRDKQFGQKGNDKKVLLENFINSLTPTQKSLWAKRHSSISKEISSDWERKCIKWLRSREAIITFMDSLNENERKIFEKDIFPCLDNNHNLKRDPVVSFDLSIAERWIFNRVHESGWNSELHGKFDFDMNRSNYSRDSHKPERIGKKYQWLAFHEFFARVSDNFEFIGDNSGNSDVKQLPMYKGPWQVGARDIDPSFNLKPELKKLDVEFSEWKKKHLTYNAWDKESILEWVKSLKYMPKPQKIILVKDNDGIEWLWLSSYIDWREDVPPEDNNSRRLTRRMWYTFDSYIVHNNDYQSIIRWAKKQNFVGMRPSSGPPQVFLGEYSNAEAYIMQAEEDNWIPPNDPMFRGNPEALMRTNTSYEYEVTLDCSLQNGCTIKLPSKSLVNGMKLKHSYVDGRFFNAGKEKEELVAAPIFIWENAKLYKPQNTELSGVLIRKDYLLKFLQQNNYKIFWTCVAGKNIINAEYMANDETRQEMTGTYFLNKNNEIYGKLKYSDDSA